MTAAQNKLLVEGKDDLHVVYSLLEFHQVPEVFRIKAKDGVDDLLETLDVELEESDLARMGIVMDADVNLATRWQSLKKRLQNYGYRNFPESPEPNGTIFRQDGLPTMGAWIMPDNRIRGMLEDFVSFLVPEDARPLWERAGNAVDAIPPIERKFLPIHRSKAHIHTWLAWQEEPGKPMGQAIPVLSEYQNC